MYLTVITQKISQITLQVKRGFITLPNVILASLRKRRAEAAKRAEVVKKAEAAEEMERMTKTKTETKMIKNLAMQVDTVLSVIPNQTDPLNQRLSNTTQAPPGNRLSSRQNLCSVVILHSNIFFPLFNLILKKPN